MTFTEEQKIVLAEHGFTEESPRTWTNKNYDIDGMSIIANDGVTFTVFFGGWFGEEDFWTSANDLYFTQALRLALLIMKSAVVIFQEQEKRNE